jgi:type I restriction enzyme S subunit
MSFQEYPTYQETGSGWMRSVPGHWTITTLGRVTDSKCDGPFGSGLKSDHYTDSGALVIRLQNIRAEGFFVGEPAYIDFDYFSNELRKHEVLAEDILIAGLGDENNVVGRACVAPAQLGPSLVKADCFRYRVSSRVALPRFVASQLSAGARYDAGHLAGGSTRSRIPLSAMSSRLIALPPLSEQAAIVAFLDLDGGKIDELVEEQRSLIELLKEKRQTVIAQAVTKGLNPSAPMKESGVAWLGKVPAHWTPMPIRLAARLESGHTPSRSRPDWWVDCTVPWFTLADVWQIRTGGADVVYETKEMVSELGLANSSARLLPKGTVMLSRTASVGFSAIMGVDMATTQDFANWVCGKALLPEFLLCVFRSMSGEFRRLMMGSTHNTIYMPDIQAFRFALPPVEEQRAIVAYVRQATDSFDALTTEAQRGVDLLLERRAALVSAAVTGKIDVRGLAPQPEAVAA